MGCRDQPAGGGHRGQGDPHHRPRLFVVFLQPGRVYRLRAFEVPLQERTARGTAIVNLLPLAPDERIQALIDTREFDSDQYLFFATKQGHVKKTAFSEYDKSRRDGLIALNLRDGDELVAVIVTAGQDDIFMVPGGHGDQVLRGRRAGHGPRRRRRPGHG